MDWLEWQRSWDSQQAAYMPDREERFDRLLDVVEAACGQKPRVLDLACGTGSISMRLLDRMPGASSVALDLDPALLRIAAGTFADDERVTVVTADLTRPDWASSLAVDEPFDAVLTATALHWLSETRLGGLYAEIADVLRSGGVFCNADHMRDPGLPELSERLESWRDQRRQEKVGHADVTPWAAWWDEARNTPELADAVAERATIFTIPHEGGSMPPYTRHLEILHDAGFREAGLVWRGLYDAAFAAVR